MLNAKDNLIINNGALKTLEQKPKAKWKIFTTVFTLITGFQLLGNPFLYSNDYVYNIIAIIILSFGASVLFVFSLYLTERLIIKNKVRIWNILVISLVCDLLFGFLYLTSLFFDLKTVGPTEGLEVISGLMLGSFFTIISFFVFFISNLVFYKTYNKTNNNKIYVLFFIGSIIFFLIMTWLKFKDYSYCDFGKDKNCLINEALTANDASLCEKNKYLNPYDRNECKVGVSKNDNNADVCRKMETDDGDWGNMELKYKCFANIALNTKNYSLCDELEDRIYKNDCYISVAKKTNDINICDKVIGEQEQFSECVENIAISDKNRNLCDKVTNNENKKSCYLGFDLNLSQTSKDTVVCDKIKKDGWSYSVVESCFSNVAEYTGDTFLCEKVSDDSNSRDVCYLGVSRKSIDINLCNKIDYHYNAYKCVTNIAINTDNRNLCEMAPAKPINLKDNCYSDFYKKAKH